MDIYRNGRYDKDKPFDVLRAEDLGSDLFEFYEPLQKLMKDVSGVDIEGSRPVFLIGGRGTGKTMVLRFLSLEMQLMNFIQNTSGEESLSPEITSTNTKEFFKNTSFIGIYLHFRITEYGVIRGDLKFIFVPYLSIKIAEQLIDSLLILKSSKIIPPECERAIIEYFMEQVREPKFVSPTSFEETLALIKNKIIPIYELLFEKSSFMTISEIKKEIPFPVLISKNVIFGLSNLVFNTIDDLNGKKLFILLDEFEFLDENQKCEISKLIKDSDETSVVFKIGSRYLPRVLKIGDSEEVLQEVHDFRQIDITKVMNEAGSGEKDNYKDLIKKILNRRLSKSTSFQDKGITKIDQLFPNLTLEDEARILISNRPNKNAHWSKFKNYLIENGRSDDETEKIVSELKDPENPIKEKLNMLLYIRNYSISNIKNMPKNTFSNLYSKNSLNLLIQLYSDYRMDKRYVGIDVFISLSSGIIRYAIELCNQALTTANNYDYVLDQHHPVPMAIQDMSAKIHAELLYSDIAHIPGQGNFGFKVQRFINDLGTIFSALHKNINLPEPEPTHFETNYADIAGNAKKIFDSALEHSYLQEKTPMDPKSPYETRMNDYVLNRIFAPKFRISYRVRGRTYISPDQIRLLIDGNDAERKRIRKEIIQQNSGKRSRIESETDKFMIQKTLFDIAVEK